MKLKLYLQILVAQAMVFCVLCFPVELVASPHDTGFWSIQLENDLLASPEDRFYTHGTEISYASTEPAPAFLESIASAIPFYHKGIESIHGWSIGQKIFTPDDIENPDLVINDRPYAGWLYLETGIAHLYRDKENVEKINGLVMTLGVVGPGSYARETQEAVHYVTDSDTPQGWDHQLQDELGFNIAYTRKWRELYGDEDARQFELSHHRGITLGNVYTYVSLGIMLRWGTKLKNDIGPPTISPGFPGIPAFRPNPSFNWYIFVGIEGRAIGRNIFLDGNTNQDSHRVEKKDVVTDVQFGIAFHYKDVRFSYSHMVRSIEFEGQPEQTMFGALNVTFYTSP